MERKKWRRGKEDTEKHQYRTMFRIASRRRRHWNVLSVLEILREAFRLFTLALPGYLQLQLGTWEDHIASITIGFAAEVSLSSLDIAHRRFLCICSDPRSFSFLRTKNTVHVYSLSIENRPL